jgi:hypothetical protein
MSIYTDKTQLRRFPLLPDAAIQPLDSSTRNLLIRRTLNRGLCGLPAPFQERGRSEETLGESKNGRFRASRRGREVRRNPHEPAQVRGTSRKMPNCIHSWALLLVEPAGMCWYRFGRSQHPSLALRTALTAFVRPRPVHRTDLSRTRRRGLIHTDSPKRQSHRKGGFVV